MTHPSPSRRALVSSITASDPCSGSVRPKAPIFSILAIGGGPFCFCFSLPPPAVLPLPHPPRPPPKGFVLPSPPPGSTTPTPHPTSLLPRQPEPPIVAP